MLISFLYKIVKKRELKLTEGLSSWDVFAFLWSRGVLPFLRGLPSYPLLAKASGPLFLGKGARLLYRSKLSVGSGCYIGDYSYINCLSTGGVRLGNGVTLREWAWLQLSSGLNNIGVSIDIGDNTYIGPRAIIGAGGPLVIGANCQIGAGVNFIAENHIYMGEGDISAKDVTKLGITIGDDCWIGNNAIILDGVRIGKSCVIAAGAIVTRDVADFDVVMGAPARVVKSRL